MAAILTDAELPRVIETELTSDLFKAYLFIDPIDGAEALSSDAMMSSVAHSVVLLRVPKGSDAEAIAADIEKNANPLKWVCVSAKKVVVKSTGNLILLVMSSEANADIIAKNFEEKI